ncbi:PIG-L family deacetylase [Amycolatopsis sacchari]|nr:PIG-L family deacetylase [Amycolatopsis sacchari]
MATFVTFHAHPDDECISCGGVMRKAHEDGHRVVLVVATRGEQGEIPPGLLSDGESLAERRAAETLAAAEILGVSRVEFLGYADSGMMGEPTNDEPGTFWTAPVEEAAAKLAAILREENAEVLTCYDDNGGYGHPDHIQVHRVGMRAAELAGTPRVFQSTVNRDHMRRGVAEMADAGLPLPSLEEIEGIGKPESEITTVVDVTPWLEYKRQAMRAHPSQISEDSFFLGTPDDVFRYTFGTECFIRVGAEPGELTDDLFK